MPTDTTQSDIQAFTQGTWRWERRTADDGKALALLLVTENRPVPCNDPVIFAVREDWLGPQSPERDAAKKLLAASPVLLKAIEDALPLFQALLANPEKQLTRDTLELMAASFGAAVAAAR
jgi:hypothetical protein